MLDRKFIPFESRDEIEIRHRNLPHWHQAGSTYFVTFRAADSLPKGVLEAFRAEKEEFLKQNLKPWDVKTWTAFDRRFTIRMEEWMDQAHGACLLREVELQDVIEASLKYFDGKRYVLDEYVIMPNHVHVLYKPAPEFTHSKIMHSWKSYTSHEVVKKRKVSAPFWMDENFDHIVRTEEHLLHYRRYIRRNPVKAGLKNGAYRLGSGLGLDVDQGDTGVSPVV